jgi:hypothetical protein
MRLNHLSTILSITFWLLLDVDQTKFNLAQPSARLAEAQCLLYNEISYEYLYAANLFFSKSWKRTVYTWPPLKFVVGSRYNMNLKYTEKDRKAVWSFEPVEGRPGIYYIKNIEYDDYMYTSQFHKEMFGHKRMVYTNDRVKPEWQESYMWRLEKVDIAEGRFAIWNVKYNESLYPDMNQVLKLRRGVYTWTLRNDEATASFYWLLKCKNQVYPNVD